MSENTIRLRNQRRRLVRPGCLLQAEMLEPRRLLTSDPWPYVDSIRLDGSPPPAATSLAYAVTFSEPVTGVDASDFVLALSGVTATPPLAVSGGGAAYTVTITGISGIGTLGLNLVDDGSIRSLTGNPLTTQAAAPEFGPMQEVTAGPWPYGAALGDFDGDGSPDVVVANTTSDTVGVLLNAGGGTFLPQVTYATGAMPWAVVTDDLDGDGARDLAVTNVTAGTVSILLGAGDGTFQPQRTFPAGVTPYFVASGDLDGDGKPDLVFANIDAAAVTVLLGDGAGNFGPPSTRGVGWQPTSVALGDVDGDGILDIAVTNYGSDTVGILGGNGDGTFNPQITYAAGARPYAVAVADLDADDDLDLAVTNSSGNSIGVFLNAGAGTFAPQVSYATSSNPAFVRLGDVTGDGIPELSVTLPYANAVEVRRGTGDGTFLPADTFAAGSFSVSLLQGDIDGDGRLDLGFANYFGDSVGILRNSITGDFTGQVANVVVGNVYRVTSAASSGTGSLRQAILDANAHPGFDTIVFALPGTTRLLQPRTLLPAITGPAALDGTTQPGVVLSGARLRGDGLVFAPTATGSYVLGLAVRDWRGSGIRMNQAAVTVRSSTFRGNGTGITLAAAGSLIGGPGTGVGNAFIANGVGIIASGVCAGAVIGWNSFRSDGTAISLRNATAMQVVANVITGSFVTQTGIFASGLLTGTLVQSNFVTGTRAYGVRLSSARGITVGLTANGSANASEANVITGNRLYGLTATGSCTGSAVRRNTITGNGINVSVVCARGLIYVP